MTRGVARYTLALMADGGQSVGELLRAEYQRRGTPPLKDFGKLMGANPDQIGRWMHDKAFPGPKALPAVARFLGVPADYLKSLNTAERRGRPRRSVAQVERALTQEQLLEHERTRSLVRLLTEEITQLRVNVAGLAERVERLEAEHRADRSDP
jgi:transcriptional regulator with XRE-family HTH domain